MVLREGEQFGKGTIYTLFRRGSFLFWVSKNASVPILWLAYIAGDSALGSQGESGHGTCLWDQRIWLCLKSSSSWWKPVFVDVSLMIAVWIWGDYRNTKCMQDTEDFNALGRVFLLFSPFPSVDPEMSFSPVLVLCFGWCPCLCSSPHQ